jgi:hypothetical protein
MLKIQFLHIPKNGGTSIKKTRNPSILFRGHGYCKGEGHLDDFIILRDPFTRFESAFYMRFSDPATQVQALDWSKKTGVSTPGEFIDWKLDNPDEVNIIENNVGHSEHKLRNSDNLGKNYFMMPQSLWHNNPDNVLLFENLSSEYSDLVKSYQMHFVPIGHRNKGMGRRAQMLTKEQEAWVRSEYHDDFVLWTHYSNQPISSRLRRNG